MGIYSVRIGKGIIIPSKLFFSTFGDEIKSYSSDDYDEIFDFIVKKHFRKYSVCSDMMHLKTEKTIWHLYLIRAPHSDQYTILESLERKSLNYKQPIGYSDGKYIFIGRCEILDDMEFSCYIKTPELLYGLAGISPQLIKSYNKLTKFSMTILDEKWPLKSLIWTFANDCACCG